VFSAWMRLQFAIGVAVEVTRGLPRCGIDESEVGALGYRASWWAAVPGELFFGWSSPS